MFSRRAGHEEGALSTSDQNPAAHRLRSVSGTGSPSGAPGYPADYRHVPHGGPEGARAFGGAAATALTALLGLWLMVAPFVLGYGGSTAATVNDLAVGAALVFGVAVIRFLRRRGR